MKAKFECENPGLYDDDLFDPAVNRVLLLVRLSLYRQFDGSRDEYALIRTAFASRIDSYIPRITIAKSQGAVALGFTSSRKSSATDSQHSLKMPCMYELEDMKCL